MAIITISRGTMSGGRKLAEMLEKKLGYRCVSREIIIKAADDFGVPASKLFDAFMKSPSLFHNLSFERERYLAYIQASLCEYAAKDNLIYHGHGGHFLLAGVSHVFRLRLVAEMPYRINEAMAQLSLSEKEAAKYVEQIDKERVKWTNFLYGLDWRSPELYDVVFNLGGAVDLDFVCEMVIHAVKQPQFKTTPESAKAMKNLLTASRVRAALADIPLLRLDLLKIEAKAGTVTIQGRVKTKKLLDAVTEKVDKVPDVVQVDNMVEVDYRGYGVD
jgi:cytidylate kinase